MATVTSHQPFVLSSIHDPHLYTDMSDKKPNKETSPAFFKGDFSFVNKDANNIDSKDHNAAVSWHVMNRYERFKKQEQARKLRASANIPSSSRSLRRQQSSASTSRPQDVPSTRTDGTVPDTLPDFNVIQPRNDLAQAFNRPGLAQSSSFGPSSTSIPASSTSSPTHRSSPIASLLVTPELSGTPPPFDTSAKQSISEPVDVGTVLSFAYEAFLPNLWPSKPGTVQNSYEISRSWEDIAAISQDDCYDSAYLALLLTVMSQRDGDDPALKYQSRIYQAQAIAELRQRLSGQGSNQNLLTMKAILALFSSETCIDSTATARVHLKMLRTLVGAAGGVILLDTWFREDLLSCDCYFAVKFGTRPLFPADEWTPGPLSQPWKARLISAGIPGDHASSVDKRIEHPVLKTVLVDLRELFRAQEYINSHEMPTEDQLLRWRQLRKFDCISRLADHLTNLSLYGHLYEMPKIQTVAALSLVLLTSMVLGCPESLRFGNSLIDRLRQAVSDAETEIDQEYASDGDSSSSLTNKNTYQKLLLWAQYIGSLAERIHPRPPSEPNSTNTKAETDSREWFNLRVKRSIRSMRLVNGWDDIRKILRTFLWSASLHDEVVNGTPPPRQEDFLTGLYGSCGVSWRRAEIPALGEEGAYGSSSGTSPSGLGSNLAGMGDGVLGMGGTGA